MAHLRQDRRYLVDDPPRRLAGSVAQRFSGSIDAIFEQLNRRDKVEYRLNTQLGLIPVSIGRISRSNGHDQAICPQIFNFV
jgi:hypothetical protein